MTGTDGRWPRLADIPEPRLVALYTGNGSGTKLFQGFLDGHPQIYMVPAYQLMYLHPHWGEWRESLGRDWSWAAVVDLLCRKHASMLDSRRIPGHDGLYALGRDQAQHIAIDEARFRACLLHLLEGEPASARTFLLAIHYAYALCRNEDLAPKRVLVYHIHVPEYVPRYLVPDFPEMLVLGTVRDPRANAHGRYHHSIVAVDREKLNLSDALVYHGRSYYFLMRYLLEGLEAVAGIPPRRVRVIRHEDLALRLEAVMQATARFIGIDDHPCLYTITFGGLAWWGDKVYDMAPMNHVNPRILSQGWQQRIGGLEWFVFEGLFHHYLQQYGYPLYRYDPDRLRDRLALPLALFLPSATERTVFLEALRPAGWRRFFHACRDEASGAVALKDYGFNAYYRHKWDRIDLQLWRPRWFVTLLAHAGEATLRARLVRGLYIAVQLGRYAWSIALRQPGMLIRRWGLSLAAWRRMRRAENCLPDALPEAGPTPGGSPAGKGDDSPANGGIVPPGRREDAQPDRFMKTKTRTHAETAGPEPVGAVAP